MSLEQDILDRKIGMYVVRSLRDSGMSHREIEDFIEDECLEFDDQAVFERLQERGELEHLLYFVCGGTKWTL